MDQDEMILVVDDDKEDHLILSTYFADAGVLERIAFADNGRRALEYLEKIETDLQLPKLIVLDLNMPLLNGTQTLLEIKRSHRLRNIPVIIFSTSENETEKRKCLSLGALEYIVKPVSYKEGLDMVKKFMTFIKN